jgi:hypothetical protein
MRKMQVILSTNWKLQQDMPIQSVWEIKEGNIYLIMLVDINNGLDLKGTIWMSGFDVAVNKLIKLKEYI